MLTSVDRDDIPDGGAEHFARTVRILSQVHSAPRDLEPLPCSISFQAALRALFFVCRLLLNKAGVLKIDAALSGLAVRAIRAAHVWAVQVRALKVLRPETPVECPTQGPVALCACM